LKVEPIYGLKIQLKYKGEGLSKRTLIVAFG